jgi:hypothetical protein
MTDTQVQWVCLILVAGFGAVALSVFLGCRAIADAVRRTGSPR